MALEEMMPNERKKGSGKKKKIAKTQRAPK